MGTPGYCYFGELAGRISAWQRKHLVYGLPRLLLYELFREVGCAL